MEKIPDEIFTQLTPQLKFGMERIWAEIEKCFAHVSQWQMSPELRSERKRVWDEIISPLTRLPPSTWEGFLVVMLGALEICASGDGSKIAALRRSAKLELLACELKGKGIVSEYVQVDGVTRMLKIKGGKSTR